MVDSHPIPYHVHVIRAVSQMFEAEGHECLSVYLSDFSIQGAIDQQFGISVSWDEPLLEGYRSLIAHENSLEPLRGFSSVDATSVLDAIKAYAPDKVVFFSLHYKGCYQIYRLCQKLKSSCYLRIETNDVSQLRSFYKFWMRRFVYRWLYRSIAGAVAIGTLNREHLVEHGVDPERILTAYYAVPNRLESLSWEDKLKLRDELRKELDLGDKFTFLFCGKLIDKKSPDVLLRAVQLMSAEQRSKLAIVYLGSGELEDELKSLSDEMPDVQICFLGFKNQKETAPYFLAADALVLMSKQMGETWGLVVNEALQAGLPCVISQHVGSSVDLKDLKDVHVADVNHLESVQLAMQKLLLLERDFDKYKDFLPKISIEHTVQTMCRLLRS